MVLSALFNPVLIVPAKKFLALLLCYPFLFSFFFLFSVDVLFFILFPFLSLERRG